MCGQHGRLLHAVQHLCKGDSAGVRVNGATGVCDLKLVMGVLQVCIMSPPLFDRKPFGWGNVKLKVGWVNVVYNQIMVAEKLATRFFGQQKALFFLEELDKI